MKLTLKTYDFGIGYRRTDIDPVGLAIGEQVDKEGNYTGYTFSVQFDFTLIHFLRKLQKFLASTVIIKNPKEAKA
jgi:hypothetical protein